MNNKIMILIIGMVLFSSFTYASLSDYTKMLYYPFDTDLLNDGNISADLSGPRVTFISGKVGNAFDLEAGTSDYADGVADGDDLNKLRTFDFWVKPETVGAYQWVGAFSSDDTHTLNLAMRDNGLMYFYLNDPGQIWIVETTTVAKAGTWMHIILVIGSGGVKLYVNGSTTPEDTDASTSVIPSSYTTIDVGSGAGGGNYFDGLIDNFFATDSQYITDDVTQSWNGGNGYNFSTVTEAPALFVTLVSPTDNNITNTDQNFTFNYTGFTADNCYLYDNRTGIFDINVTLTNPVENTTLFTNFTNLTDGHYLWNVKCSNATNDYWATTNYSLTIDRTDPGIILNPNNAFNNNNYSLENQYDNNMTLNITFTDERDLFAMSINVTKDGTTYFNMTNISLSGISTTYHQLN